MCLAMGFKTTSLIKQRKAREHGATLVEYVVGIAVGSLLMLVLIGMTSFTARTFAAQANYLDMNGSSLFALDQMSKDIRQANGLVSFAANQIVLNMGTGQPTITYAYDANKAQFVRETGGQPRVLLRGCTSLEFKIFQRTPIADSFNQFPPASISQCKAIAVKWVCARTIFGNRMNTESVQEAKIVLRNK